MQPSPNGLKLIQVFEKFSPTTYLDSARIWTIGWGHALTTPAGQPIDVDVFGPAKASQLCREAMARLFGSQTITLDQGNAQLAKDLESRSAILTSYVASDTSQAQFDAFSSLAFNIGDGNFHGSHARTLHNAGNRAVGSISIHDLAAQSKAHASPVNIPIAVTAWSYANHAWSLGLFRRRFAEVLVYSGWDAQAAFNLVEQFNG